MYTEHFVATAPAGRTAQYKEGTFETAVNSDTESSVCRARYRQAEYRQIICSLSFPHDR